MSDSNTPIEKRIQRFYGSQSLPPEKMSELKKLAAPKPVPVSPSYSRQLYSYAAFAAFFFVLLGSSLFGLQRYNQNQHIKSVAAEIALNHAKQFDTEFESPNIANLSAEMHLLDFSPVHPQRLRHDSYDIQGARYCTIDSAIAVQIHMEDEGDESYTLYEYRDPSTFLANQEKVIEVDDIKVTLWKEGEVIMGLAERAGE